MGTPSTEVAPFDITTHNGFITVQNLENGNHRTIRIRTQKEDADFMPGKRLVGLLVGSDNMNSYRNFGYIDRNGKVVLWRKLRGSKAYRLYARFLENPAHFMDKVAINFDGRCRRCNLPLTTPASVASGIGPVCEGRE